MTEDELKRDIIVKQYDVALATRNFEIELFWKRSLFFWGFIASAFVGYATLEQAKSPLAIAIACFGFICSFAWTLVNRGSKRWQENWEIIVSEIEENVTGALFNKRRIKANKPLWLSASNFSVSKIAIALSDFTVIIWFSFLIHYLINLYPKILHISSSEITVLAILGTIAFAMIMYHFGKSSD